METIKDNSYGVIPIFKKGKNNYLFCVILHRAGHWAFPKGHPKEDERPIGTARRELYEETGIKNCKILDSNSFEEKYNFEQDGQNIEKTANYFLVFVDEYKINTPEKFKKEILDAK